MRNKTDVYNFSTIFSHFILAIKNHLLDAKLIFFFAWNYLIAVSAMRNAIHLESFALHHVQYFSKK